METASNFYIMDILMIILNQFDKKRRNGMILISLKFITYAAGIFYMLSRSAVHFLSKNSEFLSNGGMKCIGWYMVIWNKDETTT